MLRIAGTVAGAVFALLLVILGQEDRTAVLVGLGVFAAALAPLRVSARTSYATSVAVFTAAIVAMSNRGDHGSITLVAVSRMLQNCVGAAIYLAVSQLAWPNHGSVESLMAVAGALEASAEAVCGSLTDFTAALRSDAPADEAASDAAATATQSAGGGASPDDGPSRRISALVNRMQPVARGLGARLADARNEFGLAEARMNGLRALTGTDRQLWKLVRSVRCINQCRLTLRAAAAGRAKADDDSGMQRLVALRKPLMRVATRVREVTLCSAAALRTLAENDAAKRDSLCGSCYGRSKAGPLLDRLDLIIPEVLSAVMRLDGAFQAATAALQVEVVARPTAPVIDTTDIIMFNSAVFAARQAAEASLALAATVELVSAHFLPADDLPDWVRLERERRFV
ncbi:hypothetical protein FNF29_06607 [Cafeteria roenbergensis]|nr:hypothetical protein FNF29_06607 [Cafeteria roenbergensis]|eukprot:KAA0148549.1 hypothetical protein FNF29_06607 [Cafeteria roenbergensis]